MGFLIGGKYTLKTEEREKALSILINSGISFSSVKKEEEGISFHASLFKKKKIEELAMPFFCEPLGLIAGILHLRKRKGLIFGGVLSLFLIYLSTFYVWSVRIEGNEELSDAQIIRVMQECGFHEGIKKGDVDVNELQHEVLSRCHELSFFSVNIHGMVADVVVHERRVTALPTEREEPYNLVADIDGVIVSSVILDGQIMFKTGDTVAKGELLVSGIMDSTAEGFRLRQAEGKVYARTHRTLSFSLPLEYYEKTTVKEEEATKIRILGHSIGKSVGDSDGNYDLSVTEEKFRLFGITFPVTLERHKASYYTTSKSTVSDFEARAKLLDDYKRYISTELDSESILSEEISYTQDEEKVTMYIDLCAIENIAVKEKININ